MENIKISNCNITYCTKSWKFDSYDNSSWLDYDLWIILDGKGTLYVKEGESYSLEVGNCFILRPEQSYSAIQDPNNMLVVFHTHFDFISKKANYKFYRSLFNFKIINYLIDNILNSYINNNVYQTKIWMSALLLEIKNQDNIDGVIRSNENHINIISEITKTIYRNPEIPHKLTNYAQKYNYSYDYLGRIFKQVTTSSFSTYVINVRLDKAKLLLRKKHMTIKEIALLLGYSDVSFFNKQFKKFINITPSQYRTSINKSK